MERKYEIKQKEKIIFWVSFKTFLSNRKMNEKMA